MDDFADALARAVTDAIRDAYVIAQSHIDRHARGYTDSLTESDASTYGNPCPDCNPMRRSDELGDRDHERG